MRGVESEMVTETIEFIFNHTLVNSSFYYLAFNFSLLSYPAQIWTKETKYTVNKY